MLQGIEVGKLYPGKIRQEGLSLEYDHGFTLYIFMPNISPNEAQGFRTGKYKFALTEVEGLLFLIAGFKGAIDLSDAPFHFGLYQDGRAKDLPELADKTQGIALTVITVDSVSGITKSLRMIGLGHNFSAKLLGICNRQAEQGIEPAEYAEALETVFSLYTTDMLYEMSTVKYEGEMAAVYNGRH